MIWILAPIALYLAVLLWFAVATWRVERQYDIKREAPAAPLDTHRCEGCGIVGDPCTGRCEAAALVRRTLAEMGVEVEA